VFARDTAASGVRVGAIAAQRVLGGQHEPIPPPEEELAKDLLARPVPVVHCRVDHVATGVGVGVDHACAFLHRRAGPALLTEGHRTQKQLCNP
jgi:hypothetical protein